MFVEVKGVQFVNKGAELMLHAVMQQLESQLPTAKLVLEPNINSPYLKRAQVGALQKFALRKGKYDLSNLSYWIPKKLRHWLINNFGIITEADVDVVLDASGFAYGDQWSSVKIKLLCGEIKRSAKYNKKFVLLPQALGPFSRPEDKNELVESFPKATLICAREETSFEHVSQVIGQSDNLVTFGDFTNLVKPVVDQRWKDFDRLLLIVPNYNMLSERNSDQRWKNHYVNLMVNSIKIGRELGMNPLILNHEGKEDSQVCDLIKSQSGGDIEIYHESDALKVKGIIQSAELIVCSRFHGCVSALSQGVPCLGTSWSHKYEKLFEEYQLSGCLLSPDTGKDKLKTQLEFALSSGPAESATSRERFKIDSEKMWNKVFASIV